MAKQITPPGWHVVQQGEWVAKLAAIYGIAKWEDIWSRSENAALRDHRLSPNVLLPGDRLYIPATARRSDPAASQATHRYRTSAPSLSLRLKLRLGEPSDGGSGAIKYVLTQTLSDGTSLETPGTTSSDGSIKARIHSKAEAASLALPDLNLVFPLELGYMDPVRDGDRPVISGVQARLNNLGFYCGPIDGVLGPKTVAAVAAFQRRAMGRNPDVDDGGSDQGNGSGDDHGSGGNANGAGGPLGRLDADTLDALGRAATPG
jgi:hypothetical protein